MFDEGKILWKYEYERLLNRLYFYNKVKAFINSMKYDEIDEKLIEFISLLNKNAKMKNFP